MMPDLGVRRKTPFTGSERCSSEREKILLKAHGRARKIG